MAANPPGLVSQPTQYATFVELLRARAIHQPQQESYCFLIDGKEVKLDYGSLDWQAQSIAAQLQRLNLRGERALLIYPAGLEFIAAFFGCLYAGVIAVPVYPPRRSLAAIQAIVANAQASTVLTLKLLLPQTAELAGIHRRIATDSILSSILSDANRQSADQQPLWQPTALDPNAPAFLQYSSGSTGQPKAVQISHANLLHNSALIYEKFGHSPTSRGIIWLPPYHDMGLIGGILQPLFGGFPVTLMSPVAFLQQPVRWLAAISRYGASSATLSAIPSAITSGAPNFAYERCIEKITVAQKAELDLSGWQVAFTGAEPIRAETLSRFAQVFADCGFRSEAFYPCYGLAEATLFVAGGNRSRVPTQLSVSAAALQQNRVVIGDQPSDQDAQQLVQKLVSCGPPAVDGAVLIVDPETQMPCRPDQIGEICITGQSMTQGYWNQPEINAQSFIALNQAVYLRTGDLGFLHETELFVTGRIKDMLIIRGRNYYPQDIERTVEQAHPDLAQGCGAAFISIINGEEQLVVTQEVNRNQWRSIETEEIARAIRAAVSEEHQLQVSVVELLKPGAIPKTSSGKVKRYVCREEFEQGSLRTATHYGKERYGKERYGKDSNEPSKIDCRANKLDISVKEFINSQDNLASATNPVTSHQIDQLITWLRDYATHQINSRLIDERRCIPPSIVLDFGNQGLLGMQVAAQYGGLELGHADTMRVLQQLGAIDPTLALFVGLNNVLGIRPIARFGSSDLKQQMLPLLATGRELAAFALTEPAAGANPQAIMAQAVPDGTGWRLNGTKIWSGSAAWAGVMTVFVQQQPGISGFVLRRGQLGLRQGPEALTMGMRGMVQNTLYLENAAVSAEQMLGAAGSGMTVAQDAMMYGRLAIAAACVGGMKRCAQLMLRYSSRRSIATGKLLEHPVVLTRLQELNAAIMATETLVSQIAQRLDLGETIPIEAYTACKTAAPEFYWQAADGLVQTLGGRGYIETNLAPQILRDARVLRIFEGPTETLNAFLGSRVMHQSQSLQQWLTQTLKTPEISQRWLNAAAQINSCCQSHCRFDDPLTAERWASVLMGEVTTLAILWASLENANRNSKNPQLTAPLQWIESQFEQKLAQSIAKLSDSTHIATASITENLIARYSQTIGDIEQTLVGEDQELDELLRKVSISPQAFTPLESSPQQAASGSDTSQSRHIQTWIMQWLSQKLKILPEQIDRHRSFADYGIDSVIAVELAQDLETWLNLPAPLEATVAWNFPSIASLSNHLATVAPPLAAASPAQLSEAELAQLLTAELIAARGRIGR